MTRLLRTAIAACLCATGAAVWAADEKPSAHELYYVHIDHVRPSKFVEYEKATKRMISEFAAYSINPEKVHFGCVSGPELGYAYVVPLESFAAMDSMRDDWVEAVGQIGMERWKELRKGAEATIDRQEGFHVRYRPALSYEPEDPRVKLEDSTYINYGFYYAMPGTQHEIDELCKAYAALHARHGLRSTWRVYSAATGADLPLYVVAHYGTSPESFHAEVAATKAKLGAEARAIGMKIMAHLRRIERKDGWRRPDLSYPSAE
jgi:hypothetical protein